MKTQRINPQMEEEIKMEKETTLRNQRLCIFLCAEIVGLLMVGNIHSHD